MTPEAQRIAIAEACGWKWYPAPWHTYARDDYDELMPVLATWQWGVAFLDHSPGPRRALDMVKLVKCSQFVVIHDFHNEVKDAVIPHLSGLHWHVSSAQQPPTIVVSQRPLPAAITSIL